MMLDFIFNKKLDYAFPIALFAFSFYAVLKVRRMVIDTDILFNLLDGQKPPFHFVLWVSAAVFSCWCAAIAVASLKVIHEK